MTQKEKARAYDEAVKKVKDYYEGKAKMYSDVDKTLNLLFPELKEDKDEKIRKSIISGLKYLETEFGWDAVGDVDILDAYDWLEKQKVLPEEEDLQGREDVSWCIEQAKKVAKDENEMGTCWFAEKWLEKQGEQKAADKIEPKFHEGDWVVQDDNILKIKCVGDTYYCFETVGGYVDDLLVSEIDSHFHLWTIQDAKDGDILACDDGFIMIAKELECSEWGWRLTRHCALLPNGLFVPVVFHCNVDGFHPATKEQRDLLFQKMKEAGYEWDAEKKELKLLVTNGGDFESEDCEQKPAWSEEDEINLTVVLSCIADENLRRWLEDVIHTKYDKPAWSEEDEYNLQCWIAKATSDIQKGNVGRNNELIDWLKSVKQRLGGEK